jgi:hypothetical protein
MSVYAGESSFSETGAVVGVGSLSGRGAQCSFIAAPCSPQTVRRRKRVVEEQNRNKTAVTSKHFTMRPREWLSASALWADT